MKIAYFVNILDQVGGAELATRRLAEKMAARGHDVTILTTHALSNRHTPLVDYAKGVRVVLLPVWQRSPTTFRRMLGLQALWAIPSLLRGTQIFQVRGLLPETSALARIARRIGAKTVCVPMASGAHGETVSYRGAFPFDRISALTEPLRQEVIALGFPAQRTAIIPNGVEAAFFSLVANPIPEPRVIFVGQFRPEKRVDLLLAAWALLQPARPAAALTLVGGGQLRRAYQERAAALGVHAAFVPDTDAAGVLAQLHQNSIFLLPGIGEGMSNALLEAMSVGLAPIVADTPANRAVITPEVNGLVYPADSAQALARALERLMTDADLRQRLGAAARQTVLARFTLDSVVDQYLALYAELLGETR